MIKTAVIVLCLSVILESFVTSLPLTLCLLIFLTVVLRKVEVFALAFFAGFMLDILTFGRIGLSSAFFTLVVYLIFLYEGKFELETPGFIFLTTIVASAIYLFLTGKEILLQTIFITSISAVSFFVFSLRNKKIPSYV